MSKAGEPFIGHLAHVATSVEGDKAKAVAWLHDVVEDTDAAFDYLSAARVDDGVIDVLGLLAHNKVEPYVDYVAKAKTNELARTVKLAGLAHNSDLSRLPEVIGGDLERVEKYRKVIALLSD